MSKPELYWQSMPEANELDSTLLCIMALMWLEEMGLGCQDNVNIDHRDLISCRDKLLMKPKL